MSIAAAADKDDKIPNKALFDFQWPAVVWLTAWTAWPGGSNLSDSGFRQQPHHAGHTRQKIRI
jgi:hypothetical protein